MFVALCWKSARQLVSEGMSVVTGCLLGSVLSVALYGPAAGEDISRFDWSGTYVGGHVA